MCVQEIYNRGYMWFYTMAYQNYFSNKIIIVITVVAIRSQLRVFPKYLNFETNYCSLQPSKVTAGKLSLIHFSLFSSLKIIQTVAQMFRKERKNNYVGRNDVNT